MLGLFVFPCKSTELWHGLQGLYLTCVCTWSFSSVRMYVIILIRAYVRDHSHPCVCIHTGVGWAHRQRVSTTFLTRGKNSHNFYLLCSWRGSNLGSLDLEFDALPTEPPWHPFDVWHSHFASSQCDSTVPTEEALSWFDHFWDIGTPRKYRQPE